MISAEQVRKIFEDCVKHTKSVTGRCVLSEGWKLTFNRRRAAVGVCHYTKKEIQLSIHFNDCERQIRNTILHEIAHALTPGDGHGIHWRKLHKELGGDGKRVCDVKSNSIPKWHVIDTTTGKVICSYNRKPKWDFSRAFVKGREEETRGKLMLKQNF